MAAILFGAIGPTFFAWLVVSPLKGLPVAAGFRFHGVITGRSVNAAWGLGTGIFLRSVAGRRIG